MKHIFHKWETIAENDEWIAEQCSSCNKIKWIDKWSSGGYHYDGYQCRPRLPWQLEPQPPIGGSNIK